MKHDSISAEDWDKVKDFAPSVAEVESVSEDGHGVIRMQIVINPWKKPLDVSEVKFSPSSLVFHYEDGHEEVISGDEVEAYWRNANRQVGVELHSLIEPSTGFDDNASAFLIEGRVITTWQPNNE